MHGLQRFQCEARTQALSGATNFVTPESSVGVLHLRVGPCKMPWSNPRREGALAGPSLLNSPAWLALAGCHGAAILGERGRGSALPSVVDHWVLCDLGESPIALVRFVLLSLLIVYNWLLLRNVGLRPAQLQEGMRRSLRWRRAERTTVDC